MRGGRGGEKGEGVLRERQGEQGGGGGSKGWSLTPISKYKKALYTPVNIRVPVKSFTALNICPEAVFYIDRGGDGWSNAFPPRHHPISQLILGYFM